MDIEDILDYMSSTELAANLFRITQTDEVLKNKNINNEDDACKTHHNVGQVVRQTIKKLVVLCQRIYQHQVRVQNKLKMRNKKN